MTRPLLPRRQRRSRDSEGSSLLLLFRELHRYVPGRRKYGLLIVTAVLTSFAEAGSLILLTLAAARLATGSDEGELAGVSLSLPVMIAGAAVLLLLRLAFMWSNLQLMVGMSTEALVAARHRLLDAFVRASFERQSQQSPAVLQDLFALRADVVASSFTLIATVAVAAVNLMVLIGVAVVIQPLAVLTLAVIATLMVLALRPLNAHVKSLSREALAVNQSLVRRLGDLTTNYRDVTAFGVGQSFVHDLEPLQYDAAALYRRKGIVTGFVPHVSQTAGLGLALLGIALASALGQTEVAVLGAVVILLLRSVSYGQQLLGAVQGASDRIPIVLSVSEAVDDFRRHQRRVGGQRPAAVTDVLVDEVSYRYREGPEVLNGVNLSVRSGEMVGIVGPSGSGKSTLLQILCGLRVPSAGKVIIGGVDHDQIDLDWWTSRVALVPQDSRLLEATLAENIQFFRDIDEEQVSSASRHAQLGGDLEQLGGLHSDLSYQGRSLSGGQIQRMAIARALAGAPELLILDEPTSALDVGTEQRFQKVLDELHGNVTMVIVAHRLSTVAACDRVIVLDGGRVVAEGPAGSVLDEFGSRARKEWELLDGN